MSTTTGKTLNLVKPELTDDHKVTIGTDLPANFQKIDDAVSAHLADNAPHSATNAATADRLVLRDSAGRAKVAAPSAESDIALLSNCFLRDGGTIGGAINYNDLTVNRVYRILSTDGATNPPPGGWGQLLVLMGGGGYKIQIFLNVSNELYTRVTDENTWTAWVEK